MQNSSAGTNPIETAAVGEAAPSGEARAGDTRGRLSINCGPRLAHAIAAPIDKFLAGIPANSECDADPAQFFITFLKNADRFISECTAGIANVIVQFTRSDEIRTSGQSLLPELIRQRCFEAQERLLESLIASLRQRGIDLKTIELSNQRLRDAASSVSAPSLPGPLPKGASVEMACEFLRSIDNLAMALFDYGGEKILGPSWDLQKHSRFMTMMRLSWEEKLAAVARAVRHVGGTVSFSVEAVPIMGENLDLELVSKTQRQAGDFCLRQFAIALVLGAPFLFVSWWGANWYITAAALASAAVAVVFVYRGISRLVA